MVRRFSTTGSGRKFACAAGLFGLIGIGIGMSSGAFASNTRTLSFFHTHTKEQTTVTFWRDGSYDAEGLKKLNWFLRDWRVNEPAKMDPKLFNILWEVHQEAGSREPIHIISAYRSPTTNAMLRRRSSGVSEHSQHMLGKAMDVRFPDVETGTLRAIAMKMQYGGVGYYPSSAFVHVDTGSVRAWPRMSQEQLARLFPDGKTVHLPPSGKPLARYAEAKADLAARDKLLATASVGNPLAGLLGSLLKGGSSPGEPPAQVASANIVPAPAETQTMEAVPLPPRRPVLAMAFAGPTERLQVAPKVTARLASAEPMVSADLTPTSRLLFSVVSVTAAPTQAELGHRQSAANSLDRSHLQTKPLVVQTFSTPLGLADAPTQFQDRTVGLPGGLRLAGASLSMSSANP
jgi:uncharacterized protein YcbK (DUF882 family)